MNAKTMNNRQTFYVNGQLVEMWENPDAAFRCGPAEIQHFATGGDWVSLFNALVLSAELEPVAGAC